MLSLCWNPKSSLYICKKVKKKRNTYKRTYTHTHARAHTCIHKVTISSTFYSCMQEIFTNVLCRCFFFKYVLLSVISSDICSATFQKFVFQIAFPACLNIFIKGLQLIVLFCLDIFSGISCYDVSAALPSSLPRMCLFFKKLKLIILEHECSFANT